MWLGGEKAARRQVWAKLQGWLAGKQTPSLYILTSELKFLGSFTPVIWTGAGSLPLVVFHFLLCPWVICCIAVDYSTGLPNHTDMNSNPESLCLLWEGFLNSISLGVLIYKMGIITAPRITVRINPSKVCEQPLPNPPWVCNSLFSSLVLALPLNSCEAFNKSFQCSWPRFSSSLNWVGGEHTSNTCSLGCSELCLDKCACDCGQWLTSVRPAWWLDGQCHSCPLCWMIECQLYIWEVRKCLFPEIGQACRCTPGRWTSWIQIVDILFPLGVFHLSLFLLPLLLF